MLELALVMLVVSAAIYGLFLVVRLVFPILRSIFASALGAADVFIKILLHILFIFLLIQAAVWLVLYPVLKSHFNEVTFSMLQLVAVIAVTGISALFLVLAFGRSSPFKQYGILAIIINSLTTIFTILSLYSLSKDSAANFSVANLHCKEAVFTLSTYLTSINISTYLFYGYDKLRAWIFPKNREYGDPEPPPLNHWGQKLARWVEKFAPWVKTARVPEWVLHWHSICGGTLGAILAQGSFRHKTKKKTFQSVHRIIVLTQIVLLVASFFLIKNI
ncbi:MAG TPA: DUF1294 domain-containing protein [Allocoleopsis sp.]